MDRFLMGFGAVELKARQPSDGQLSKINNYMNGLRLKVKVLQKLFRLQIEVIAVSITDGIDYRLRKSTTTIVCVCGQLNKLLN